MNNKLNKTIRQKLDDKLPSNFDRRFWQKFDQVPNRSTKVRWQLASALSLILIVSIWGIRHISDPNDMTATENKIALNIMENEELLENMELLAQLENVDLTEKEWEILLSDS